MGRVGVGVVGQAAGLGKDGSIIASSAVRRRSSRPELARNSARTPPTSAPCGSELEDKTHGRYLYLHPVVGRLDLGFETLRLPDDPDQALIMHTTEADSPSATALRLLATWGQTSVRSGSR